jgi:hypothetical protein
MRSSSSPDKSAHYKLYHHAGAGSAAAGAISCYNSMNGIKPAEAEPEYAIMINQEELQNHWQELAEQLGLEPDQPAGKSPPAQETRPAPRADPASRYQDRPREVSRRPADQAPDQARGLHRHAPVAENTPVEAAASEAPLEEVVAPVPGVAPAADDEEAEQGRGSEGRGRRRRRRRSKSGRDSGPAETNESAEAVTEGTAPKESPIEEEGHETPRGGRRGRGRRRPETGKPPSRREAVAREEESLPEDAPAAADDDEVDDLSNWQAPSWQELIASLYRPDR